MVKIIESLLVQLENYMVKIILILVANFVVNIQTLWWSFGKTIPLISFTLANKGHLEQEFSHVTTYFKEKKLKDYKKEVKGSLVLV